MVCSVNTYLLDSDLSMDSVVHFSNNWSLANSTIIVHNRPILIFKIQPKTRNIATRLRGITTVFEVYCFRLNFNISELLCFTSSHVCFCVRSCGFQENFISCYVFPHFLQKLMMTLKLTLLFILNVKGLVTSQNNSSRLNYNAGNS